MPDARPVRTAKARLLQDWLEAARPLYRWTVGESVDGYYVAVEAQINGVTAHAYTELERPWLEELLDRHPRSLDYVALRLLHALVEWRPNCGT